MSRLSATRALVDSLRPLLRSNHSDRVIYELIDTLVTISDIQRKIGEFQAALDTSREALAVARDVRSRDPTYHCIEALACHAHSLVDGDAYDDATALLQEAISITSSDDASHWREYLGLFGVVHAHAAFFHRPSCIDKVISASRAYPSKCARTRPHSFAGHPPGRPHATPHARPSSYAGHAPAHPSHHAHMPGCPHLHATHPPIARATPRCLGSPAAFNCTPHVRPSLMRVLLTEFHLAWINAWGFASQRHEVYFFSSPCQPQG